MWFVSNAVDDFLTREKVRCTNERWRSTTQRTACRNTTGISQNLDFRGFLSSLALYALTSFQSTSLIDVQPKLDPDPAELSETYLPQPRPARFLERRPRSTSSVEWFSHGNYNDSRPSACLSRAFKVRACSSSFGRDRRHAVSARDV